MGVFVFVSVKEGGLSSESFPRGGSDPLVGTLVLDVAASGAKQAGAREVV